MSISRFFTVYKGAALLLYPYLSGDYFLYNILHGAGKSALSQEKSLAKLKFEAFYISYP
jgi:hypothetical protein